jgi:hypothetical protein
LKFTAALDSGHRVEFTPQQVQPLTLVDLHATASGANPSLQISWAATELMIDGGQAAPDGIIHSTVVFQEAPRPYALVPGGWLPLPLAIPPRFLVDSNVVADLRKLNSYPLRTDLVGFDLWMRLFENGAALFNPVPYAWEGQQGRAPDYAEFVEAFESGASEIRAAIPGAAVVTFGPAEYSAALAIRSEFETNACREAAFLEAICPFLVDRIRQGKESRIEAAIFAACERQGVPRNSLVTIAALSCLYEDQQGAAYPIGRHILKPSRNYSAEAAYNAVSDIGHLRLAIISSALHGNQGFALATSDRALASFWCALRPLGRLDEHKDIDIESDLAPELFPRLSNEGLKRLEQLLRE